MRGHQKWKVLCVDLFPVFGIIRPGTTIAHFDEMVMRCDVLQRKTEEFHMMPSARGLLFARSDFDWNIDIYRTSGESCAGFIRGQQLLRLPCIGIEDFCSNGEAPLEIKRNGERICLIDFGDFMLGVGDAICV